MSKHTPGNWIAKPRDSADWIDLVTDDPETCGGSAHSLPFASCRHFNQEANARLIAAAPELLETLRFVARLSYGSPRNHAIQERVRAVIAKVEGGDQ